MRNHDNLLQIESNGNSRFSWIFFFYKLKLNRSQTQLDLWCHNPCVCVHLINLLCEAQIWLCFFFMFKINGFYFSCWKTNVFLCHNVNQKHWVCFVWVNMKNCMRKSRFAVFSLCIFVRVKHEELLSSIKRHTNVLQKNRREINRIVKLEYDKISCNRWYLYSVPFSFEWKTPALVLGRHDEFDLQQKKYLNRSQTEQRSSTCGQITQRKNNKRLTSRAHCRKTSIFCTCYSFTACRFTLVVFSQPIRNARLNAYVFRFKLMHFFVMMRIYTWTLLVLFMRVWMSL